MSTEAVFDETDRGIYADTHPPEPTRHVVTGQGIYTPEGLQEGDVVDEHGNLLQRDGQELSQKAGAAEGAPEAYGDFTLPEGLEANEAELGEFHTVASELGLSQGQAQKLVDLEAKRVQGWTESLVDAADAHAEAWAEQAKSDPELGGEAFESNVTAARQVVKQYGDPELRELLSDGLGNHPALIRFALRVSKALEGRQETTDGGIYG